MCNLPLFSSCISGALLDHFLCIITSTKETLFRWLKFYQVGSWIFFSRSHYYCHCHSTQDHMQASISPFILILLYSLCGCPHSQCLLHPLVSNDQVLFYIQPGRSVIIILYHPLVYIHEKVNFWRNLLRWSFLIHAFLQRKKSQYVFIHTWCTSPHYFYSK